MRIITLVPLGSRGRHPIVKDMQSNLDNQPPPQLTIRYERPRSCSGTQALAFSGLTVIDRTPTNY